MTPWFLALGLLLSPVNGQQQTEGFRAGKMADDPRGLMAGEERTEVVRPTEAALVGTPGKVIQLLFERNQGIIAAEEAAHAAREKVGAVGTLPDPMMETVLFLEPIETRNGPMEAQFMLGQKIPLWGKLRRERQVAEQSAELAVVGLQLKKINAVFQMRQAWENYLKVTHSLEVLRNYRQELESFKSIALTQYSTGTGLTQHPILKLQIEIALVESQINTLQSNLESVNNDLQLLFDGGFDPVLFEGQRMEMLPSNSNDYWLAAARATHPQFRRAQLVRQIAILENELAARKNFPDLVAGFTYTTIGNEDLAMAPAPGADAVGVKVGLNIPLWFGRNKSRVHSTRAMIRSREAEVAEVWNQIEDAVRSTKKNLDEIEDTHTLYKEQLLQESDQMLASAFSAYETGKISFLDLLDSERMVVRVRLEFEAVEARRRIANAQLLKDVGIIQYDKDSKYENE